MNRAVWLAIKSLPHSKYLPDQVRSCIQDLESSHGGLPFRFFSCRRQAISWQFQACDAAQGKLEQDREGFPRCSEHPVLSSNDKGEKLPHESKLFQDTRESLD